MNAPSFVPLLARLLLALMFILAGIDKLGGIAGTAGYIASVGLPAPQVLAVAAGLLEVVAGVMLLIGFKARWAALALAGFTLVATFIFHRFWAVPEAQQMVQQLFFLKNLAVTGGLLLVFAFGAGGASVDVRRTAAA
jgi:putative oxidoreductase